MMKYKILCLHGAGSTGAHLKKQLEVWPLNVVEKMDFVFIDAPFLSDKNPFPTYKWYFNQEEPILDSMFKETIAYIEESMVKLGPFDGVLGFSQGAFVAATLPGMQAQGVALTKVEDIKFVMLISGAKLGGFKFSAPKLAENAFSSPIQIPSLHCFGETDKAKLTAIELLGSFVDPFVIYHSGGHEIPTLDEKGFKVMISFLDKIQESFPAPIIRSHL